MPEERPMSDDAEKSDSAFRDDLYKQVRTDTERIVNDLLAVMRNRRDDAVDRHLREGSSGTKKGVEKPDTEPDLARLFEIRMSHSTGFAHALLQGAVEAFEDQKAGLELLKRIIEVELVEMEQEARFVNQATSAGSTAIN
jgi:hypothetical protein